MKTRYTVAAAQAGQRLDAFLADQTGLSRSYLARLVKEGLVTVDGQAAKPSQTTSPTSVVEIEVPEQPPAKAPGLEILYEDGDIIVVNKPAGLLVHSANNRNPESTVADFARSRVQDTDQLRPGIIHRLDRQTSGVLIIAKTPTAKKHLQQQFANRKVNKTYTVLVQGRPKLPAAKIELPVGRSASNPLRRGVDRQGRPAITSYETLKEFSGYTLLAAHPQTGRTHQLRAHFAHLGHPIAGDRLYGAKPQAGLTRQFLHAASLEILCPDGIKRRFDSSLPQDLKKFLDQLA